MTHPSNWFSEFSLLGQSLCDLLKGMLLLRYTEPCVTIFGSARLGEGEAIYEVARKLGSAISRAGFAVMTGGGPGLMEAVNRGAQESGGRSLGCRMHFSFEQNLNSYLDKSATVRHFFVRKVILSKYSSGFIVLPGGFGTMDELFEVLTLIQTQKMRPKPVILFGEAYWRPLLEFMERMVPAGTITASDMRLVAITDDVSSVVDLLAPLNQSVLTQLRPRVSVDLT